MFSGQKILSGHLKICSDNVNFVYSQRVFLAIARLHWPIWPQMAHPSHLYLVRLTSAISIFWTCWSTLKTLQWLRIRASLLYRPWLILTQLYLEFTWSPLAQPYVTNNQVVRPSRSPTRIALFRHPANELNGQAACLGSAHPSDQPPPTQKKFRKVQGSSGKLGQVQANCLNFAWTWKVQANQKHYKNRVTKHCTCLSFPELVQESSGWTGSVEKVQESSGKFRQGGLPESLAEILPGQEGMLFFFLKS